MRPWHIWPVSIASLVWAFAAAADYLLTELRSPAYLSLFSSGLVAYIAGLPAPIVGAWAIGVWGGLAGVLMMILNLPAAAMTLAVAAMAQVVLGVWLIALAEPPLRHVAGPAGDGIMVVSVLVPVLVWLYARALHARGVLR